MRRTVRSLALMLALSAPVYAGEMQFPVAGPPPTQSASVTQEPTGDGEIHNPLTVEETAAVAVITLLSAALRLF